MQKCSVGTPADLGFYNLILKCGNSYRAELQKDENLKICKGINSAGTTVNNVSSV
ncbi:hypothetical protein LEP1GSC072_3775 [Leptospira noguchii str. Bonito]|nr:hypothetical protein LEP1GSC072_3775 [Leptospira noguchii str. Bonito]